MRHTTLSNLLTSYFQTHQPVNKTHTLCLQCNVNSSPVVDKRPNDTTHPILTGKLAGRPVFINEVIVTTLKWWDVNHPCDYHSAGRHECWWWLLPMTWKKCKFCKTVCFVQ